MPLGLLIVAVLGARLVFTADTSDVSATPPSAVPTPGSRSTTAAAAPTPAPDEESAPPKRSAAPSTAKPTSTAPPARAVYLGDSLATENQDVLADLLDESGSAQLRKAPHSGTTLCDYLEGEQESLFIPDDRKAAALVRSERPEVVVLQFWGNSWGYTPCMKGIVHDADPDRYYDRYAADARALTEQITKAAQDAGIPRPKLVWVLQGPDAVAPDRVRRVNDIYRAQAKAAGDLTSDAGARVSRPGARYTYVQNLPCNAYERANPTYCSGGTTAQLHRADDPLHFCLAPTKKGAPPCTVRSPGILRYTQAIAATVDDYLRQSGR
ncbi:SGNH/GDSL hydrolase family protein [Streptomyces apocyni]|uniref:SGNH/GDSL hydrolase family protein n=1 Tax=Streptomyces apocyni TaxID=2654677 RepID=UPI001E4BAF1D|nr:SGNH/GDSL hydrolase family protein [Streptomyces apocyni]